MPRSQQAPPADPMFDNFVQTCFKNPQFFESMKQFYYSQQRPPAQPQPPPRDAGHQFQPRTERAEERREEVEHESVVQKKEKRLPANPLLKYASKEPK